MKIRLSVLLRLFQYGAVGIATAVVVVLTLRVQDVPGAHAPEDWVVILCAVIIGGGGVIEGIVRTASECVGDISFEQRLKVEDNLKGLLVSLDETTKIPWTEVGLTAFVVRWTPRRPWCLVQARVARIRMRATPRPTRVLWTKRKGVLGRCWRTLSDAEVDHDAQYRKCRSYTKKVWKSTEVGAAIREGLSYKDFLAVQDFGYVLASPIFDSRSRYRGCLVVQVAARWKAELGKQPCRDLIHLSANSVGALLFGE